MVSEISTNILSEMEGYEVQRSVYKIGLGVKEM
jgi:hypothetical protein